MQPPQLDSFGRIYKQVSSSHPDLSGILIWNSALFGNKADEERRTKNLDERERERLGGRIQQLRGQGGGGEVETGGKGEVRDRYYGNKRNFSFM